MDILKKELAKQRTIALFQHQEDEIAYINDKLGENGKKPLSYANLIRFAVDLALEELKSNL